MTSSVSARLDGPVITILIHNHCKDAKRYCRPECLVGPNAGIHLAHSKFCKMDKLCELLKENFCDNSIKIQHYCL